MALTMIRNVAGWVPITGGLILEDEVSEPVRTFNPGDRIRQIPSPVLWTFVQYTYDGGHMWVEETSERQARMLISSNGWVLATPPPPDITEYNEIIQAQDAMEQL